MNTLFFSVFFLLLLEAGGRPACPKNNVVILRIRNPKIVEKAKREQKKLWDKTVEFELYAQPPKSLHLTLFVTTDVPDRKLEDAKRALRAASREMRRLVGAGGFRLTLKGVHEFRKGVLYFAVRRDPNGIEKLHEIVEREFRKVGLPPKPGKRFHPHVTLVALNADGAHLKKRWKIHHGVEIGTEHVEALELCEDCSRGWDPRTRDYTTTFKAKI
ncbi:hypothetical protein M3Y99_00738200 [Aphelenchoides fujianensis]|nr:hypothetical protein M3Y99_00738200 [Aphelenchoides fujianensis]